MKVLDWYTDKETVEMNPDSLYDSYGNRIGRRGIYGDEVYINRRR